MTDTPRIVATYVRKRDALAVIEWRGHLYEQRLFDAGCFNGPRSEECTPLVAALIRKDAKNGELRHPLDCGATKWTEA